MKAISLWQPWASAMAVGSKEVETRHWSTNVRGEVAIHAAARFVKHELDLLGCDARWKGALAVYRHHDTEDFTFLRDLPFGAVVAVGNLVAVVPTEHIENRFPRIDLNQFPHPAVAPNIQERAVFRWTERDMGNYDPGRFAWIFESLQPLTEPVPFKGKQGFFNVPDELLEGKL